MSHSLVVVGMKEKRQIVLLIILCVTSVMANFYINSLYSDMEWPESQRYFYDAMFDDSVLYYRPAGTDGLSMINMHEAVIVITEIGPPLACASLTIVTADGRIDGPCVKGIEEIRE